jgi:hypothetical protein
MSVLDNVLQWLFEPIPPQPSVWYIVGYVLFGVVLAASAAAYLLRRRLFPGQSLHVKLLTSVSEVGVSLGLLGLVLLIARSLAVPYLSMRFLLILAAIATIAAVGYGYYYYRRRYPALNSRYQADEARMKYIKPVQSHGSATIRRRSKKRRK